MKLQDERSLRLAAAAATTECVIYLRISQDQKGDEAGVDRQKDECLQEAERRGWSVREVYVDNDKSATKDGVVRDDFERMLRDLAGSPLPVICWHTDRLVRTVADLNRVIKLGVNVHGLYAGNLDLSTPAGRAVAITLTAWAAYEGEQKAERQKAAHRQRVMAGRPFWSARPFGYNTDGTLHETEAPALQRVYRRVLGGMTLMGGAELLNADGFATSKGKVWKGSTLRGVLLHPRNAGIMTYNGQEVGRGNWAELVDETTFRTVERILTDPSRRTAGPRAGRSGVMSFLAGIAECECGEPTRVIYRNGATGRYRMYGCRLGHASARAEWLEDWAGALLVARFTEPVAQRDTDTPDSETLRAELDRLRQKGEQYAQMFDDDQLSLDQFNMLNQKNRAKIEALGKQVAMLGVDDALSGLLDVEDLADHWENVMTVREQNGIAKRFFDRVVILPRGKGGETKALPGRAEFWVRGDSEPHVA